MPPFYPSYGMTNAVIKVLMMSDKNAGLENAEQKIMRNANIMENGLTL